METVFTPLEIQIINAAPNRTKQKLFFICWTLKEAYAKARGEGLALDFKKIDFSPALREAVVSRHNMSTIPINSGWSLQSFTPSHGYTAALCLEDTGTRYDFKWYSSLCPRTLLFDGMLPINTSSSDFLT